MRRRDFIRLLGCTTVAWPLVAQAQQPSTQVAVAQQQAAKIYRLGFLGTTTASELGTRMGAFRAALRDLGYVEGNNRSLSPAGPTIITIDCPSSGNHYQRLAA